MKKTPIQLVKEQFGDKQKLVEAVQQLATDDLWIDRVNGDKGLERVSNAKLLRLHATLSRVKSEFGTRSKLVSAILDLEKRGKDEGLKSRLEKYPVPRLLDLHRAASRRSKTSAKKAKTPAAPKRRVARSKKAKAKAAKAA